MDTKRNHYNTVFFYLLSNLLLLFMLEMQRNTEDLSFFSHRCCLVTKIRTVTHLAGNRHASKSTTSHPT